MTARNLETAPLDNSPFEEAAPPLEAGLPTQRRSSLDKASSSPILFAHPSEEEFARILDFYHVPWQYEPSTFPIEWDRDGNVISAFTPDFYLPEQDVFIEITTLRQALVTKKNRKVRRFRELYPEVTVRVLYASDFRKLIEKFVASGRL